jgi:predicted nuclease of predicted toxin-antitoxin system
MRVLFDQGTPVPLRKFLTGHDVSTAHEMGWSQLDNGRLLSAADGSFDLLVTTDKNMRYQQALAGRRLAVLVLPTTNWPRIQRHAGLVQLAIDRIRAGEIVELELPT